MDVGKDHVETIRDFFDAHEDEFLNNEKEPTSSLRRDVRAFLLLQELSNDATYNCIISDVHHYKIVLSPEPSEVFENATEEQMVSLIRLGVSYDSIQDMFFMYV